MPPSPLPNSLWAAIAIPAPATGPLTDSISVDVAIVGGGYLGLSTALHLAEAGKSVAVIEASEPGWGASGRNGGQVIPGLKIDPDEALALLGDQRGERLVQWAGRAPDLVFDLIQRHGITCDPVRNGWIQPAYTDPMVSVIENRCRQWASRGAPVQMLERDKLPAMLGTSKYLAAWIDRRGGSINPLSYARGLAAAALKAGARIYSTTTVQKLRRRDSVWQVSTSGGEVAAAQVVVATGAYGTDTLIPGLGRTMIPVRIGEVATQPLTANVLATILPGRQCASDWRHMLASFRITPDGRLMMGGSTAAAGEETPRLQRSLHRTGEDLFGYLGPLNWAYFWSGIFAVTTDKLPHIHQPEPGCLVALGCNGRGIAISTAMGKMLAERLLGRPADDLELAAEPLRPIPFHALRKPFMNVAIRWKGLKDKRERRRSTLAQR